MKWCARRDLNPQPSDPKSDALSIELRAHLAYFKHFEANLVKDRATAQPQPDMYDRDIDRVGYSH